MTQDLKRDAARLAHKARSCGNKRRYGTKETADAVIAGLKKSGRIKKNERFSSYECEYCGHYHFGHMQ